MAALPDQGPPPIITVGEEEMMPSQAAVKPEYSCVLQVDYPSHDLAQIVHTALDVDSELQPDRVHREMTLCGHRLTIKIVAVEARYLRSSLSAFMDMLALATRTIEEFGPSR
eukprot:c18907_g1_i1 orf=531-866(-)